MKKYKFTFADMHCHILPGVDDGSKDMEMSLNMLRIAADNNIHHIILTPHNKIYQKSVTPSGILKRVAELQDRADEEGLDIKLYPGNELYYDSSLTERLDDDKALSLNGTRDVLVEFGPGDEYSYISQGLRKLSYDGWHPILAHCERYECLHKKRERIDDILDEGVRLQINADSVLMGPFSPISRFVKKLLSEEKVSFVATDAHRDTGHRAPKMADCADYIIRKYGEDYAREILYENVMEIIEE